MEAMEWRRANSQTAFRETGEVGGDPCVVFLQPEFNFVDNRTDQQGRGGLEGAVEGQDGYRHNDYVEDTSECCEANDDRGDYAIDPP